MTTGTTSTEMELISQLLETQCFSSSAAAGFAAHFDSIISIMRDDAPPTKLQVLKNRGTGQGKLSSFISPNHVPRTLELKYTRRRKRQTYHKFPHSVTLSNSWKGLLDEIELWCKECFGERGRRWNFNGHTFYFVERAQANMFVLTFKGRTEPE